MRSTRSLLIVYFLALLGVGLGVVVILADRVVTRALDEKERTAAEAIDLRTLERVRNEQEKFDRELLTHARLIARIARREYLPQSDAERRKFDTQLLPPSYFAGFGPTFSLWAVTWHSGLAQQPRRGGSNPNPQFLYWSLARSYLSNLRIDELYLKPIDDDDRILDYVQINGTFGSVRRSENLITAGFVLPFERSRVDKVLEDWTYDEVHLPGAATGRRVIFKTPLPIQAPGFDRFRPSQGRPAPADPSQYIYIHVARLSNELEHHVATFRSEAADEKTVLQTGTVRTVGWIRLTLAFIAVLTFLACLLGSSWLIRRGLTPLSRLSDAVSQVSEKDFRLAVERDELTTELQPIHTRITETLDQLRMAFEREKQAVADISHELRTPVASLLATIDVSLRKPRTAESYLQTLKDCRAITKQLSQLVEKVMTLAYLDAGQTKVAQVPVDVMDIATSCAAVIRPLAEAHGLQFEMKSDGPIRVQTDPDKLREVLTNLLHNAVEYNNAGGRVELDVSSDPENVRFRVKDTGIGMTDEVREKIFERFYRADSSRTATGVHAGLGLAIVKEYVDRLGGSISVESEPGAGSSFCVSLPAA
ncbi:sensor histidine kinase [Limnoglobus roseus]|uniref:histidine kinase n=1 Tax=Limnoglobus roseus TaxID=2598579 RepID=A0A5C1ANN3_9BACT|nr:HAMP domain-containing sensor histidine kinase [Limnoglobus roseus]QEL18824.1 sensor histidine kinase [Limnoglobus roseus]